MQFQLFLGLILAFTYGLPLDKLQTGCGQYQKTLANGECCEPDHYMDLDDPPSCCPYQLKWNETTMDPLCVSDAALCGDLPAGKKWIGYNTESTVCTHDPCEPDECWESDDESGGKCGAVAFNKVWRGENGNEYVLPQLTEIPEFNDCRNMCSMNRDCEYVSYDDTTKVCVLMKNFRRAITVTPNDQYHHNHMWSGWKCAKTLPDRCLLHYGQNWRGDHLNEDIRIMNNILSAHHCQDQCDYAHAHGCEYWVWEKSTHKCYLKKNFQYIQFGQDNQHSRHGPYEAYLTSGLRCGKYY